MQTVDEDSARRDKIDQYRNKNILYSIRCGISGVKYGFQHENNFCFYLANFLLFLLLDVLLFGVSADELIIYIILSATTVSIEFLNTAVEEVCNLISTEYNSSIKHAKDLGSAADMTIGFVYYGLQIYWLIRYLR